MSALAAPQYGRIKNWLLTGQAPNYCGWGYYHGFLNDNNTSGGSLVWANHLTAHTGQPVEFIMVAMSLSLGNPDVLASCVGCPQHFFFQVPLAPNNGTYLAATIAGTNDHYFDAIVAEFISLGLDMKQFTIVLGWEFFYGSSSFQWSLGQGGNTIAQHISAQQHVVTRMRAQGYTGSFMCDMSGASVAQLTAGTLWPGDSYMDMVGSHIYNIGANTSMRFDETAWWNYRKPYLDAMTGFARAHGKLIGASEMGLIVAAPGDTTSSTYVNHTGDVTWYWTRTHDYMQANCDVWAGLTMFNQDLGNPTTEFSQLYYFGTDPATQASNNPHDTNGQSANVYDTVSAQHSVSSAAYVRSIMVPGSMQIASTVPGIGGRPKRSPLLMATAY